jgi:hypothetical protein
MMKAWNPSNGAALQLCAVFNSTAEKYTSIQQNINADVPSCKGRNV